MKQLAPQALPGTIPDPLYPESDGRPMGDTDYHALAQIWLREALEDHFAPVPDVYVASNILFYHEHGNPKARRDPDILVARGVGKHLRLSYRMWEEKVLPRVFFEIASKRTWRVDVGIKRELYAQWRIPEYFLFDPLGKFLDPVLQGFRLSRGKYGALKPAADGSLLSVELGLRMVPEGGMLRLIDAQTGQPILTRGEQAEQARKQTEQARRQAEQARAQAEQDRQRAEQLAAEVKRLRAQLARHDPRH